MREDDNYWQKDQESVWKRSLQRRLSRRQAIRYGAMAGVGLAALGCAPEVKPRESPATPTPAAGATPTKAKLASTIYGEGKYPRWIPCEAETPKKGGSFGYALVQEPPHFDPRLTLASGMYTTLSPVYNRVIRTVHGCEAKQPGDFTIVPDLAIKWDVDKDYKTYTFKLREGVQWQNLPPVNGRKFTSADVKYAIEAYQKTGVQAGTFADVDGIETPDELTVIFHLNKSFARFLETLSSPLPVIFPREILEEDGDLKTRVVGTGPFQFREFKRRVSLTLEPNPTYWEKDKPYIDTYNVYFIPDAATRLAAFRTGQTDIHGAGTPTELNDLLKSNPDTVIMLSEAASTWYGICWGKDNKMWQDVRVRRALAMAIDRQKIVDTIYEGNGMWGWGIMYYFWKDEPPTVDELGPYWQFKPEEAKKLMVEAGYPNGFQTEVIYYEYTPAMTSQLQLLQQWWKQYLGVDLKINKIGDYTTWTARFTETRDYPGLAFGFQQGSAQSLDEFTYQYMHSKAPKNFFGYVDPVQDKQLEDLRTIMDPAEVRKQVKKIWDRELDQVNRLFLPWGHGFSAWKPRLKGYRTPILRSIQYGGDLTRQMWVTDGK